MPELTQIPVSAKDEITEGSMGEFDHQMLLRQYVSQATANELAPHLRGGQFKIYGLGHAKKPLLNYASGWDSNQNAATFFLAYEKVLQKKWKQCDASTQTATMFAGTGDNGSVIMRRSGKTVSSVEGLTNARDWNELKGISLAPAQTDAVSRSRIMGEAKGLRLR